MTELNAQPAASPAEELRAAATKLRDTHPHLTDLPMWLGHVAETWKDLPVLQEGPEQDDALALARKVNEVPES